MVSFVKFARKVSLVVGFHLGTLRGYFFRQDFWPNLNFRLEHQRKLALIIINNAFLKICPFCDRCPLCNKLSDMPKDMTFLLDTAT